MVHSKVAIVGDIHSNALALRAALCSIEEHENLSGSVESVIFLGDLFTYGVRPRETLSILHELIATRSSLFVLGNHDQMYIDLLLHSCSPYYDNMPDWIKESVDFTLSGIDSRLFFDIQFSRYHSFNGLLVSHANFNFLSSALVDWSYVNTSSEHYQQLRHLSGSGSCLGVLGHTHRNRCFSLKKAGPENDVVKCIDRGVRLDSPINLLGYHCSLLNAGSIGQPRDKLYSSPSWLLVEFDDLMVTSATYVSFEYDLASHVADISNSTLSASCIEKLNSFFSCVQ